MKEIILTQGQVALVDDEDYEYLNQRKWQAHKGYKTYYANAYESIIEGGKLIKRKRIWMHRIIMNTPNGLFTDHKNHNGLDNRRVNLKIVSKRENQINRRSGLPKSGYNGVHINGKKYYASIIIDGKFNYLGQYDNAKDANNEYVKIFNSLKK